MKPVNGNVVMSAEDILLKVAANKGITAAVAAPVQTEDVVEGTEVPAATEAVEAEVPVGTEDQVHQA